MHSRKAVIWVGRHQGDQPIIDYPKLNLILPRVHNCECQVDAVPYLNDYG